MQISLKIIKTLYLVYHKEKMIADQMAKKIETARLATVNSPPILCPWPGQLLILITCNQVCALHTLLLIHSSLQ